MPWIKKLFLLLIKKYLCYLIKHLNFKQKSPKHVRLVPINCLWVPYLKTRFFTIFLCPQIKSWNKFVIILANQVDHIKKIFLFEIIKWNLRYLSAFRSFGSELKIVLKKKNPNIFQIQRARPYQNWIFLQLYIKK